MPSDVGVKANTSSSAPVTPVTDGLPVVEIRIRPSESSETASRFSAVVVSATSLPSKYMLKVPAVVAPKEVASKRTMSCGVTAIPLTVIAVLNAIRRESASIRVKANISVALSPTSEPSKNRLQAWPSNRKISSSADATPPTV